MGRRPPVVTHLTTARWGGSYPRVARWLRDGFREIGRPYDAVFLEGPAGAEDDGLTRVIHLGKHRSVDAFVPLVRYLRSAAPGLTLVKPPSLAIAALAAGRISGRAVAPWEPSFKRRETDTGPRHRSVYFAARTASYTSAPLLAAVSDDVAEALRSEFPSYGRPVVTVANPIDADGVRKAATPAANRDRLLEFCAVGRMAEEKGYDVLLRAFATAAPSLGTSWRLRVLGKGPRAAEMQALASDLDIDEHVEFLGWVDNPYPLMAAADVFVHAARFEPFGLVYTEALSLGIPVLATDCPGGAASILENGAYGILVPNADHDALAKELVRLAEDSDLRDALSEGGRERVKAYAPHVVAASMAALADSLAEGRSPGSSLSPEDGGP